MGGAAHADGHASPVQNHVLFLDGDGDYVEIADSAALKNIDRQVTMEAWIKPTVRVCLQWISH